MLELNLLSPLEIKRDGAPLKLASRRTEALLIYLVRNPQTHAREVLANLFWDDLPQKKAMGNLRVLLANLRKELGPYVTITRKTAALNPESDIQTDLSSLEETLSASRSEIDQNGQLSKKMAAELSQSLQAFPSMLLPGFYLKDGLGFEEWLATEREWLWTRVVEALDDLATEYLQWGDYKVGIEQAQRLVNLDPVREEGHQLLMQLWAADGQTTAALAQYERCVEILDKELGVQPHPYTTELYEKIRSGSWKKPKDEKSRLNAPHGAIPNNLPRPLAPVLGREVEMARLADSLKNSTSPLVSIIGPGGIGKSVLALEAARQLLSHADGHFKDGVLLVELGAIYEVAQIPLAIASAVGYRFQEKGGDETAQILDFLTERSMLLIFDNVEQLIKQNDESDFFAALLGAAPNVKLLVTSRHRLNLPNETALDLDGLTFPVELSVDVKTLTDYSGVQLFLDSVRRAYGKADFDETALVSIGEICRMVQGMPLAIVLAAATVEYLSPAEIGAELSSDIAFLSSKHIDKLPFRQQSMQAVFNHSWNLLTAAEQQIFARMSIFRGRCTRQVAQAVSGGSLRELLSLAHKSLLVRDISTGRFRVHTLLRQMAADKLRQMGQSSASLHQLALETIEKLYPQELDSHSGELAVHAEMAGLIDKARLYFTLAAETARDLYQSNIALEFFQRAIDLTPSGDFETVYRLRIERIALIHLLGRREAQLNEIGFLHDIAERVDDNDKRGEVLIKASRYSEAMGDYAKSGEEAGKAAQFILVRSDLLAEAYLAWGNALSRSGQFAEAKEKLEQAIVHAEAADKLLLAGQSYQILGIDSFYQGDRIGAKKYFEQNIEIFRRLENRAGEAAGLGNLGILMLMQCDYAAATEYIGQTVDIFHELKDVRNETIGRINLGSIAHKLGQFEKAQVHYEHGLKMAEQTADLQSQREAHNWLGNLYSDLGQLESANEHYQIAFELAQGLDFRGHVVELQVNLATVFHAKKDSEKAMGLLEGVFEEVTVEMLGQADDMLRTLLRAFQILNQVKDRRAQPLLEVAHTQLQKLAEQIDDDVLRRFFLQDVPAHREIMSEFAVLST